MKFRLFCFCSESRIESCSTKSGAVSKTIRLSAGQSPELNKLRLASELGLTVAADCAAGISKSLPDFCIE